MSDTFRRTEIPRPLEEEIKWVLHLEEERKSLEEDIKHPVLLLEVGQQTNQVLPLEEDSKIQILHLDYNPRFAS